MGLTPDRHIRVSVTLALSIEVTRISRCSLPEYRRKFGAQRATMNDNWSVVIQVEASLRAMCSTVVTLSRSFDECVAAGATVDFMGEGRGSHYWGHPGTVCCLTVPFEEASVWWGCVGRV